MSNVKDQTSIIAICPAGDGWFAEFRTSPKMKVACWAIKKHLDTTFGDPEEWVQVVPLVTGDLELIDPAEMDMLPGDVYVGFGHVDET